MNAIEIQDRYITRMSAIEQSDRAYCRVLAQEGRKLVDALESEGFTQAQAERALYDVQDMVVLNRIAVTQ